MSQVFNFKFGCVVKILLGWVPLKSISSFKLSYKSCRQVLTSSNNSQLLLKLEILDKFRLATNQQYQDKENCKIF
jgi:hypothetical protein